jgi:threonine synthase
VDIFLETARPGKFGNVVEEPLGLKLELLERLEKFLKGEKKTTPLKNDSQEIKKYLLIGI